MSDRAIREAASSRLERTEDHDNEMSQIREVLFGELVHDVDRRFADIGKSLVVTQQAIRAELRAEMARIANTLDNQTGLMDDMLEQEQVARANLQRELSDRLRQGTDELGERLDRHDADTADGLLLLKRELLQHMDKIEERLSNAQDEFTRALGDSSARLAQANVERNTLAKLFEQMAVRLRDPDDAIAS